MRLSFGPDDTFFFDDGKGHYRWKACQAFTDFMNQTPIKTVHNVALGEHNAYFIHWENASGQSQYSWNAPSSNYMPLHNWLFKENLLHDDSVEVSLGPNDGFFAHSNQGHRWRNIPDAACDYYQKFTMPTTFIRKRVKTMDIGFGDKFLGIGTDGTWFWELEGVYSALEKMIAEKGTSNLVFVSINPFAPNQHFAVFSDDTAHWALPPHWLAEITNAYQRPPPPTIGQQFPPVSPQQFTPQPHPISSPHSPLQGPPQSQGHPPPYSSSPPQPPPNNNSFRPSGQSSPRPTQGSHRPSFGSIFGRTPKPSPPSAQAPPQQYFPYPQPSAQVQPHVTPQQTIVAPDGSKFDWNQAMGLAQDTLNTYNTVSGNGGNGSGVGGMVSGGATLVNNLTGNGLMVGQMLGQSAAACAIM